MRNTWRTVAVYSRLQTAKTLLFNGESCDNSLLNNYIMRYMLCSWARHLTITVPLSTQEYKWVLVSKLLGKPDELRRTDLQWTIIPSREGEILSLLDASCYRNQDKLRSYEPVSFKASLSAWMLLITLQIIGPQAWKFTSKFFFPVSAVHCTLPKSMTEEPLFPTRPQTSLI